MRTITNKPAVQITNLSFSRENNRVFESLNLKIGAGEHVALLGTNGSGKSTLMELIIGSLKPDSGTIENAAARIAFVPQRSALNENLPITVLDTVRMGRWSEKGMFKRLNTADHEIVKQQLERLKISDLAHRQLPRLSGGQRQRALIAQALAQEAEIILLDEPEAGLDSESAKTINDVLKEEAANGVTVIVATHERETAESARRCVVLDPSKKGVSADGPPEKVINKVAFPR